MTFDLHVHTVIGSSDSSLKIDELVGVAKRTRLSGVALTEHRGLWERHAFAQLQQEHPDILFINAMEVESTVGHVTVFGLARFVGGIHNLEVLRQVADARGAYLVLAHPFRYILTNPEQNLLYRGAPDVPRTPRDVRDHAAFDLVDAIEVSNGGTSAAENAFAMEVARYFGKPAIGGSDAHSTHGLGNAVTVFDHDVPDTDAFMESLHAGHFRPGLRDAEGRVLPIE